MKKLKPFLLFVALFASKMGQPQSTGVDSFIHHIIAALKNKDPEAFVALFPDKDQSIRFLKTSFAMLKKSSEDFYRANNSLGPLPAFPDTDSIMAAEIEKLSSQESLGNLKKIYTNDFGTLIQRGEEKGLNWKAIRFLSHTVVPVPLPGGMGTSLNDNSGKKLEGDIYFEADTSVYYLRMYSAMYLPDEKNWFGPVLGGPAIRGEVLKEELEKIDIELSGKG